MRSSFCLCVNEGADQLHCFRFIDKTIPLLPKSEISSLQLSSGVAQTGLYWTFGNTEDRFSRH